MKSEFGIYPIHVMEFKLRAHYWRNIAPCWPTFNQQVAISAAGGWGWGGIYGFIYFSLLFAFRIKPVFTHTHTKIRTSRFWASMAWINNLICDGTQLMYVQMVCFFTWSEQELRFKKLPMNNKYLSSEVIDSFFNDVAVPPPGVRQETTNCFKTNLLYYCTEESWHGPLI